MPWKNGEIPESELTIFHRGRNSIDGDWYHGLTPATYARHLALVARAKARTGRTLTISEGWGAYRPVAAQIIARNRYGNGAAIPRTSSHGGFWEGRETMAMDYSNWGYVYDWDRAAFYADVRAVGLTPGMIEPSRGYPDEPWHVIDLNPRTMPAYAAAPAATPTPATILKEDTEVANVRVNMGNCYTVGFEQITHNPNGNVTTITKNVMTVTDELHELSLQQFVDLLKGLGIPESVLDAQGNVLSPELSLETGKRTFVKGGVWSRSLEALAEARATRRKLVGADPAK